MSSLNLSLAIKVIENKKKRVSSAFTKVSKVVQGVVFLDPDEGFKVSIDTDKNGTDEIILSFTEKSYDLLGKETVFRREPDAQGRYIRIIRNKENAKFFPGLPEQYIPFAPNWIVKGYIVKSGIKQLFDFTTLVGIDGYSNEKLKIIE